MVYTKILSMKMIYGVHLGYYNLDWSYDTLYQRLFYKYWN